MVIGVFALFTLIALPKANESIERAELETTARLLASDLRLVQQMSVNSSGSGAKTYSIVFNNAEPFGYKISDGIKLVKKITFPAHVVLNGSPSALSFSPEGAPTLSTNSRTISLSSKGKIKYVIITGATGRVRVSDTDAAE